MSIYSTDDGSKSLHSNHFNENFHDSNGALKEAYEKYVIPADLYRFKKGVKLNVLDVCIGLGYNTACLIEAIKNNSIELNWWGLELDKRPLSIALNNQTFKENWSPSVLTILKSIRDFEGWVHPRSAGQILWGDARQQLNLIPNSTKFDLILHDAFSPKNCPELWSEEFLKTLTSKLTCGGRLITYCSAAAVRATLKRAGLQLRSLLPNQDSGNSWSTGTLAILSPSKETINPKGPNWQLLTPMEEEHLLTRAATPYRDLSGLDDAQEILARRKQEQHASSLEKTKNWQRRWLTAA